MGNATSASAAGEHAPAAGPDDQDHCGYRVLGVQAGSPAASAGLVSFFDFIVMANHFPLRVSSSGRAGQGRVSCVKEGVEGGCTEWRLLDQLDGLTYCFIPFFFSKTTAGRQHVHRLDSRIRGPPTCPADLQFEVPDIER